MAAIYTRMSGLSMNPPPPGSARAALAQPAHLDHRAFGLEAVRLRDLADSACYFVIIHMRRFAAFVAYQKDAVMLAAGVAVGEVGIGAFYPERQVVGHEQVKNAIDAVGSHPSAAAARKVVGNRSEEHT